jgi:hypothetical protein
MELKQASHRGAASANLSRAHFVKSQIVGSPVSHRHRFAEDVIALIVIILTLAVLTCLVAVAPAVWTVATAAAAAVESYIPVELSQCLSIKDNPGRLVCYDELARRPMKGASASQASGEVAAGIEHRSVADAVCDVPANDCRKNWELTE